LELITDALFAWKKEFDILDLCITSMKNFLQSYEMEVKNKASKSKRKRGAEESQLDYRLALRYIEYFLAGKHSLFYSFTRILAVFIYILFF
jgi:hypothetical protein